jgi:3'-phosphoadenosine 5'-phosphosulfate synthase
LVGDNKKVFLLDGDVIRTGLNKDLGFTPEARTENIRRIAEVAKLFSMSGQICFVAFISPYAKDRNTAKDAHKAAGIPFVECHISASLEVCEQRDTKGLYKKARAGEIKNFTGVSDPYDAPEAPEMNIDTGSLSLDQATALVMKHLSDSGVIKSKTDSRVVQTSIVAPTAEEAKEAEGLKSLELNQHQVEYLQTIGDGWAYPLNNFMNELELLQCL